MTDAMGDGAEDPGIVPIMKPRCTNLECRQDHCGGTASTTLRGVVNIPAGNLPLYGVRVYVPNAELDPIKDGVSCWRCDAGVSGKPVTQTVTDYAGEFRLLNVPSGKDVPLVIQAGKWRRQVTIPYVAPCVDTVVPSELTRMPRNQAEGSIPKIALTTGSADALECLLRKLGLDESEFTPEYGGGRVNLYGVEPGTISYDPRLNGGAGFTPGTLLWNDPQLLKKYDVLVLSCEGTDRPTNKPVEARQNLQDYLNMGGRVFASHWHNYWVEFGPPPFPSIASWNHRADPLGPVTATIDTSFDRGMTFANWLKVVDGSSEVGKLTVLHAKNTIESVNPNLAQRWIYVPELANIQYLAFNAPVGSDKKTQCGRMVLTDIHVSADDMGDDSSFDKPFPTGCITTTLSAQEKALMFMLFDLSNCLEPELG
jgi:hypothetical protein